MEIDVNDFEKTSKDILAPVYPVIAESILKETGVLSGLCIDAGVGTRQSWDRAGKTGAGTERYFVRSIEGYAEKGRGKLRRKEPFRKSQNLSGRR